MSLFCELDHYMISLYLEHVFCSNGICSMLDSKGNMLYRDGSHLNIKGSIYAAPFIFDKLRE